MNLSKEEVEHIALLARLSIAEGDKQAFGEQLSQIVTFIDQLREVDTEGVPPTATISSQANVMREDVVEESLSVEKALSNAPQQEDGFFVVPKIITDSES